MGAANETLPLRKQRMNIPPAWKVIPFKQRFAVTKRNGRDLSRTPNVPFIPMEQIPIGELYFSDHTLKSNSEVISGTYFEEGDLLLSKITPSFENGKQGIVRNIPGGYGLATTEVVPIRPIHSEAHLPYLAYYLLRMDVRGSLAEKMEGATGRQRLSKHALENLPLLLPPLHEQRAIASILMKIQIAIKAQDEIAVNLRELKAASLAELFRKGVRSEKLTQTDLGEFPQSWELRPLGTRCRIMSGGTPAREVPSYWNGNIPWVRTGEINYQRIVETAEHITEEGLANSSAKMVKKGAVLLAMYGQGVTRGKVAMLGIDATTNQACAVLIPDETLDPTFLYAYCMFAYERIRELGHGANQKNLSADILKQMPIPVPPTIDEQREIGADIEELDIAQAFAEKRRDSLELLFSATLQALMTGQVRIKNERNLNGRN